MKARAIQLASAPNATEAVRRIAAVRFAELLALGPALASRDARGMHDLRIAAKRLRYALERFSGARRGLNRAAQQLARLQDALGEAHDLDALQRKLDRRSLVQTAATLRRERKRCIDRARRLWRRAFLRRGSFKPLVAFTRFEANA
jgi:CHAD domain-containing protein